jgi:hypothetical protein
VRSADLGTVPAGSPAPGPDINRRDSSHLHHKGSAGPAGDRRHIQIQNARLRRRCHRPRRRNLRSVLGSRRHPSRVRPVRQLQTAFRMFGSPGLEAQLLTLLAMRRQRLSGVVRSEAACEQGRQSDHDRNDDDSPHENSGRPPTGRIGDHPRRAVSRGNHGPACKHAKDARCG